MTMTTTKETADQIIADIKRRKRAHQAEIGADQQDTALADVASFDDLPAPTNGHEGGAWDEETPPATSAGLVPAGGINGAAGSRTLHRRRNAPAAI